MATGPELAVVVLAVGAPPSLVEAVRSLQNQNVAVEIVVVNSGGGRADLLLAACGIQVPVIQYERELYAGAARNAGIQASSAPYVGFLASDCLASAGWAAARLRAHGAGAAAVACAVINSDPRSVVAWASHLALHARRLPRIPRLMALTYGASYDRSMFREFGLFVETLRIGEDTEFHSRLPLGKRPVWSPAVRTVHQSPTRFLDALRDQFRRGSRVAAVWPKSQRRSWRSVARIWWRRTIDPIRISRRAVAAEDRLRVQFAWALLPWLAAAYCLGWLADRTASSPEDG